jgi:integrase
LLTIALFWTVAEQLKHTKYRLLVVVTGELRIPRKCQAGRAMRPLTEKEVEQYLEVFSLREKLIVRLAIFEGMRPGEILALRWKSVAGSKIQVQERVYKRKLNTPKNGKTREGRDFRWNTQVLEELTTLAFDPSEYGFVFPSEKVTTPLSLDNLWRRTMHPKLVVVGLDWATFQGATESVSVWRSIQPPIWIKSDRRSTS